MHDSVYKEFFLANVLIRLIGRYLAMSLLFYFPGLIIGIIIAVFHRLGKQVILRQPLYNAVCVCARARACV
jgi:hypothetical protein